jgi:hypothetical protein
MMPVDESLTTPQVELQIPSYKGCEDASTVGTHFQELHTYRELLLKDLHYLRKLVIMSKE